MEAVTIVQTYHTLSTNLLQKLDGSPHTLHSTHMCHAIRMLVVGATKFLFLLRIFKSIMYLLEHYRFESFRQNKML